MKQSKLEHSLFRRGRRSLLVAFALTIAGSVASAGPSTESIDPERSTITIHVSKSGLFRAFADDHEIQAPIKSGSVDDGMSPSVQVVVDAGRMHVLDAGSSAPDRQQVQTRMIGPEVLDANRFPEIHFESTSVDRLESAIGPYGDS
jgi:polyisoprenoid-binding protein YceI